MSRFIKSKVRSIRDGRAFVGVGAMGVAKTHWPIWTPVVPGLY